MDANALRNNLAAALEDLKAGKIKAKDASAMASLAHAMIDSAKVQVAYYALRRQAPAIPFLDSRKVESAPLVHRIEDDEPDRKPIGDATRQPAPPAAAPE